MATQIIVVPMPITARRRRERGFNQCELLANEIERLANDWIAHNSHDVIGKQVGDLNTVDESVIRRCRENRLIVVRDLLVRKLHKSRQTLKDREERLESAHDIFAVNENVANRIMSGHSSSVKIGVQPKTSELQSTNADQQPINKPFIIVIDDVITTGGTIRDAISTLKKAGFENTWGLSVAH
jgi:predicted amidophosphoribosyltransferase